MQQKLHLVNIESIDSWKWKNEKIAFFQKKVMEFDEIAEFALNLSRECGDILAKAFHARDHNVVTKCSDVDLVTATDQLIEKTIIDKVKDKYPGHRFIGEETTAGGEQVVLTDHIT